MAERKDNKCIRIADTTWLRLLQFMASLTKTELQEFKAGLGELPGRLTVNDAIVVLLDRQDAHRARSAKSSAKKKQEVVDSGDNGDEVASNQNGRAAYAE